MPLSSYAMSLLPPHGERYRIVQLLKYYRNGFVRISGRKKSNVYTYRAAIFCYKGCPWRIKNSLSFCSYMFAIIILVQRICKAFDELRSIIYFYFDLLINTLVIHQFELAPLSLSDLRPFETPKAHVAFLLNYFMDFFYVRN